MLYQDTTLSTNGSAGQGSLLTQPEDLASVLLRCFKCGYLICRQRRHLRGESLPFSRAHGSPYGVVLTRIAHRDDLAIVL